MFSRSKITVTLQRLNIPSSYTVFVNMPQGMLNKYCRTSAEFLKFPANKKFPYDSTIKIFMIAAKALS